MSDLAGRLRRWHWRSDDPAAHATVESADANRNARHPLLAALLAARGLAGVEADHFLQPDLRQLDDPKNLAGVEAATRRILQAVADQQHIVVYGDYDVDGVTASAILYHAIKAIGGRVSTYVPHRLDEGYGLNSEAITALAVDPALRSSTSLRSTSQPLIVSVDCGITAVEPAKVARELGLDLIITDHHSFDPHALPDACAIVHPDLPTPHAPRPTPHASSLCGAGVAFKLAWQILRDHCGADRLPARLRDLMMDNLSLAALGTVADVVPLVAENRLITVFGLRHIKDTQLVGLNALIDAARLRSKTIDSYHVGFVLGPRLNACGRMGHAREAVKLLTDAAADEATQLAAMLTQENDRRRTTERAIFEQAQQMVLDHGYDRDDCRALVLAHRQWHPGVVGIVASRLVEAFGRPAVMLCIDETENIAKGSARSVEGLCLHTALCACGEHLQKFGGHAMAAGMTLAADRIDAFRQQMTDYVNQHLSIEQLTQTITLDAEVTLHDCELPVFEQIQKLAPFGRGNPSPRLLLRQVTLDRPAQRMGNHGKHLSLYLRQEDARARAVAFSMGDYADELPAGAVIDLVFKPQINHWNGRTTAELHVLDFRFSLAAELAPRGASKLAR
ncbi:MAG: single-stranded-DNA-specific exonuclease RecJ [Phycisphaeraceae bacterium]|nr:single-stranded-DNA-specific exonuclease RecJ [Phycisphaeraceae bacterium]